MKSNMYFKCDLVDVNADWDREVKKFSFDVYHLSGWLKASELIDGGKAKGIIASLNNKKLLLPVIVREINNAYWDLTSSYGYGGPLYDTQLSSQEIDFIILNIISFLKENNCVSWFIRLHPVINSTWNTSHGVIVEHGFTLSSDLTKSEAEHWKETSKGHRYSIKKAIKNGVSTYIESFNRCNMHDFLKIYQETMWYVSASDFYFFDINYFMNLIDKLSDNILLITACLGEQKIASSLYLHCGETGIMQYHLSGTFNKYRYLSPSTLINHMARDWGRNNKYKILHFGGGVGSKKDSLYEYKKGLSSQEHVFKTQRIIVNDGIYRILLKEKGLLMSDELDFFPLYRKNM